MGQVEHKNGGVRTKGYMSEGKGGIGGVPLRIYAPPQTSVDILISSIRNRIQKCKGKRICACLVYSSSLCLCLSECICVRIRLLTRSRRFAVMPHRLESSGAQPCDDDSNGLDKRDR